MKKIFDKTALVTLSLLSLAGPLRGTAMAAQLTCNAPLAFGEVAPCNSAGSFSISPQGVKSGATGCITLTPGNESAGGCVANTTNIFNTQIQLTVPASATIANGGADMVIDDIILATSGTQSGPTVIVNGAVAAVGVGATLNVEANQPSGAYTGTFTVTATFQ